MNSILSILVITYLVVVGVALAIVVNTGRADYIIAIGGFCASGCHMHDSLFFQTDIRLDQTGYASRGDIKHNGNY